MTIQNANAIVQRIGPCRIALDQAAFPELSRELALMGCETADIALGFPPRPHGLTAGFLSWTQPDASRAFATALRRFDAMDALILQSCGQDRRSLEGDLFAAGWQRHPGGMMPGEYPGWTAATLPGVSIWQRVRGPAGDWLRKGRSRCSDRPLRDRRHPCPSRRSGVDRRHRRSRRRVDPDGLFARRLGRACRWRRDRYRR
ncbi:hypothetical protein ACFSTI_00095 [Rhizorhabdus histidinilytica]